MSIISELVGELRAEAKSTGKYGVGYTATLLMRSADTIEMLSEKARGESQADWYWRCPKCDHIVPNLYDECVWCLEPRPKDEPQTCSFSDCDNFKNPDYERCIECKRKQIKLKTEQSGKE